MDIPDLISGYLDPDGRINRLPGKRQKRKLDLMMEYRSTWLTNSTLV